MLDVLTWVLLLAVWAAVSLGGLIVCVLALATVVGWAATGRNPWRNGSE